MKRQWDDPPRIPDRDPIEMLVDESDQLAESVAAGLSFSHQDSPEAAIADSLNAVRLAIIALVAAIVRADTSGRP